MSEDQSCMFYAEELLVNNDQESNTNYTLDLERSYCKQNMTVVNGQNITTSVYV